MSHLRTVLVIVAGALLVLSAYLLWTTMQAPLTILDAGEALGPGGAALVGALVGGGFTIVAQVISARAQARIETSRKAAERSLADAQWTRDAGMRAREALHLDVRDLLEELIAVHRELEEAKPTLAQRLGEASWMGEWSKVWTDSRSLKLDVYRELILDPDARKALERIRRLLDGASEITDEAFTGKNPVPELQHLGMRLASSAIRIVSQYLRDESYAPKDESRWADLEQQLVAYIMWEVEGEEQALRDEAEAEHAKQGMQAIEAAAELELWNLEAKAAAQLPDNA